MDQEMCSKNAHTLTEGFILNVNNLRGMIFK